MDKQHELISVIIPTIGRESLERTLLSLVECEYPNLEIIVVTGGEKRTKRVCDIVDKVRDNHIFPISICFKTKELLPAEAKNIGLKDATGKYVTFLDDDDIAYNAKFENLSKFLDDNPDYFAAYGMYDVYDVNGLLRNEDCGGNDNTCFDTLVENNYIASGSILLRNTKEVIFSEEKPYGFGEDWTLWLDIVAKHKVKFIPVAVYGWTQNIVDGFTATFRKEGINWKEFVKKTKEEALKKWKK